MLPLGYRAIILKENHKLIGTCGLHHLEQVEGNPVEIAYDITRSYWANGYATESAHRLLGHGFLELGIVEIAAAINPSNIASARVAEKLGMTIKTKIDWPNQGLVNLYAITKKRFKMRNS